MAIMETIDDDEVDDLVAKINRVFKVSRFQLLDLAARCHGVTELLLQP
jgi:hypothetical protein